MMVPAHQLHSEDVDIFYARWFKLCDRRGQPVGWTGRIRIRSNEQDIHSVSISHSAVPIPVEQQRRPKQICFTLSSSELLIGLAIILRLKLPSWPRYFEADIALRGGPCRLDVSSGDGP